MRASSPVPAPFRSQLEGLAWPALAGAIGMSVLALNYQWRRSERWPAAAFRAFQQRQLAALLAHAARHAPFYARRLYEAGFSAAAPLDDATWRRIPILTRREVQANADALRAKTCPESHGSPLTFESSGSTGIPVKGAVTRIANLLWDAVEARDALWHRRRLAGSFAAIRHPREIKVEAHGLRTDHWGSGIGSAFHTGPGFVFDIRRPIPEQLDWLLNIDPDYLLTYPSVMRELVLESGRRRQRPRALRTALTFGEQLPGDLRELVARSWQVALEDNYSAGETGAIALQCPEGTHYHIQAESVFVEVLDENDQPCAPGAVGRVVATPLHNFAMPLIRYEIGDYAEAGAPACSCGRKLPVLTRILGRVHNMMRLPDGKAWWPLVQYPLAYSGEPIIQWQVVQRSLKLIEVRLVVDGGPNAALEERLRRRLYDANPWSGIDIAFTYHEHIARSAGGKYEEFYSEVADDA